MAQLCGHDTVRAGGLPGAQSPTFMRQATQTPRAVESRARLFHLLLSMKQVLCCIWIEIGGMKPSKERLRLKLLLWSELVLLL